jgi:signal transduction histidine kinase
MRSLLMVPVFLGSPHGYEDSPSNGAGVPSSKKVEDLGVLVLMSTKPEAFEQNDVVITALAQIVAYHIWANKKIHELESRKAEISELRQLMPKYEHATIAAAVTSGTMHTVRNHVVNVTAALDKLLSFHKIRDDFDLRKLVEQVKRPFDDLTSLYDRLFKNVFGGFEPQFEVCDIADQVQEARDYMETTFRQRGANFKSFLREARLPKVKADSILLKVAFINFFKNSIDANARNITVRGRKIVDTYVAEDVGVIDRAMVEVTFEDDGFGIPKESWELVFKPFETAHKKGGTGLGLAVNAEIMDKHEGEVKIVSSVIDGKDHGTAISITLPVSE